MRDHPYQLGVKHVFDLAVSATLLILLSPLLAAIALAIKLGDGGPVFFRQQRVGRHGDPFTIWKFRTMIVDADRYLDAAGRATRTDRVTRVGRILRTLSLDELPQLINILIGDMSIIGPRPVLAEQVSRYTPEQFRRLEAKPGVTGLAQIRGRNTLKWSERIRSDIEYVDRFSLWLDASILLKTVKVVVSREGIVLDRNPNEVDDLAPKQEREMIRKAA